MKTSTWSKVVTAIVKYGPGLWLAWKAKKDAK
jgi:hypothetical protein